MILTDLRMPHSDGCWLISRLKGNRRTVQIPGLVLTGQGDSHSERLATFLGAEKFLEKPIRSRQLIDQLRPYIPE